MSGGLSDLQEAQLESLTTNFTECLIHSAWVHAGSILPDDGSMNIVKTCMALFLLETAKQNYAGLVEGDYNIIVNRCLNLLGFDLTPSGNTSAATPLASELDTKS